MSNKMAEKSNKKLIVAVVVIVFLLLVAALFILLPGNKNKTTSSTGDAGNTENATGNSETVTTEGELMSGKVNAVIDIKDYGTISLELDADAAPITVTNFVKLANEGFYNGLTFHRIMEGFMMQGGDPQGNGMGGSDENIKGEFAMNGVDNPLSHTRGAISMARSGHPDSASSQFFICHQDANFLDGQYACFGYVTDGIEVVDAVCEASEPVDDNGTILPEQQPVINSIEIK